MHHGQQVKCRVRHGYDAKHATLPLLERLEHHGFPGEVHAVGREGQGFGHPAPGVMQDDTESAHFTWKVLRGSEKRSAFLGGQIEPVAFAVMEAKSLSE